MRLDLIGFEGAPVFQTHMPLAGTIILGAYAVLTLALLFRTRRDFLPIEGSRHILFFAANLLAAVGLAQVLLVRLDFLSPVAGPPMALLGTLPLVVAAAWLGPGPALVVGLASGLARAGWGSAQLMQPFEMALWGGVMSALLRQPYRVRVGAWLRQPLVTAPLVGLGLAWPLSLLAMITAGPLTGLAGLEATLTVLPATLAAFAGEALVAGLLVQGAYLALRDHQPVKKMRLVSPPWLRRLNTRILVTITPLIVVAIVILVGGVAVAAYQMATQLVIDQMVHNAATASDEVPVFVQVGRSLIRDLASDERLLSNRSNVRQARLDEGLRAVPFFQQLIFFDAEGNPANTYPDPGVLQTGLAPQEEALVAQALDGDAPADPGIYTRRDEAPAVMSFVTPVYDPETEEAVGVLLGRTSLDANPLIQPVADVLRDVLVDSGEGFIIDQSNTILLSPTRPERQLETLELSAARETRYSAPAGRLFRETAPDGTQQLVYLQPIEGYSDWSVVVSVPNQVVLALAGQIALPMLITLLAMAAIGLPIAAVVATRLTKPLESLALAADRIAAGRLEDPIEIAGEDEAGRLGLAFEHMRQGLKARLDEQEKLLEVSYAVSSSLKLADALPPILGAALDVTAATGVRIVLTREDGPPQTYEAGEATADLARLDEELVEHADNQGTLVVSRMERARGTLKSSLEVPRVKALAALPLRSETVFQGILWLAYEEEHEFEQAELTFLSNLASQASFAVTNARLFETAEGRHGQLAAVLSSTPDAVLAIDNQRRLLLVNPAAERALSIEADEVRGQPFEKVVRHKKLGKLLKDLDGKPESAELMLNGSQTWLANASPVAGPDDQPLARVVVLRDITDIKEVNEMKNTFVNAVSHDLRVPLTYMEGFIDMLPMVGDLNERQQEYTQKIKTGMDQMTELIDRLLNLGRIEAGAPVVLEACNVKEILSEAHEMFLHEAEAKNLDYELNLPEHLPHLPAETTLLRQAITNLLQNAVKFTPPDGTVTASATVDIDSETLTIAVADTGPGIKSEDLERLFRPFTRANDQRTATIKGSGVGLAIVKGVAERHGGRVRVETEPGKGSTFYLDVPLHQSQAESI